MFHIKCVTSLMTMPKAIDVPQLLYDNLSTCGRHQYANGEVTVYFRLLTVAGH